MYIYLYIILYNYVCIYRPFISSLTFVIAAAKVCIYIFIYIIMYIHINFCIVPVYSIQLAHRIDSSCRRLRSS